MVDSREVNTRRPTRDRWDKFEILSKGIAAILITGGLTAYGISSNKEVSDRNTKLEESARLDRSLIAERNANLQKSAQEDRKLQVYIETMNHRESAMSEMRSKMFDTLMQSYFRDEGFFGPGKEVESRVAILETIGLNFHDVIHLKPLFEGLDFEITELIKVSKADRINSLKKQKRTLQKVANRIKDAEIRLIEDVEGGEEFNLGKKSVKDTIDLGEHGIPVKLYLHKITNDNILLQVLEEGDPIDTDAGFTVGFFDMPLQDNSRLGQLTYSVLLKAVDTCELPEVADSCVKQAKISAVRLPSSYDVRNNLTFDQVLLDFLEDRQKEKEKEREMEREMEMEMETETETAEEK